MPENEAPDTPPQDSRTLEELEAALDKARLRAEVLEDLLEVERKRKEAELDPPAAP